MSNPGQSDRERHLAARLKQFCERGDSLAVSNRHMPWRKTSAGNEAMAKLNELAVLRIHGQVTQYDYEAAVHELATENAIPLADMRVMAEGVYEGKRCYYLAAELIPVALGEWYNATERDDGN